MIICLQSTDLMRRVRLSSAWKRAGHQVTASPEEVAPELLVVDLSTPGALDTISRNQADFPQVTLIAFGPHTDSESLKKAEEAGVDKTVSQGSVVDYVLKQFQPRQPPES
jgi:hypothetical protein